MTNTEKLIRNIAIPAVIAIATGAIEMRVAIARLETQALEVDKRLDRIESAVAARYTRLEEPHGQQ